MNIGDNIKQARKALDMSQDELAEKIGANRVTISKYENGNYLPSVPALERLARALETTTAALSGIDDGDKPKTEETRILTAGLDKMPKAQRIQALNVVRAMFAEHGELFKG